MKKILFSMFIAAVCAACVTVNIYFPAAKVEKTADEIVNDVYGTGDNGTSSFLSRAAEILAELAGPRDAWAQEATSVSNAAIRGLKNQLRSSHQALAQFYTKGNVGVANNGLVAIRGTQGLNMKQISVMRKNVDIQNSTRKSLYQEVAKALNQPSSQVPKIQKIFADQWRQDARQGWFVQDDSGQWRRK